MGERRGKRDGGGCGEMKAVGMWARKVGRRSERTGGVMKLTILAVVRWESGLRFDGKRVGEWVRLIGPPVLLPERTYSAVSQIISSKGKIKGRCSGLFTGLRKNGPSDRSAEWNRLFLHATFQMQFFLIKKIVQVICLLRGTARNRTELHRKEAGNGRRCSEELAVGCPGKRKKRLHFGLKDLSRWGIK